MKRPLPLSLTWRRQGHLGPLRASLVVLLALFLLIGVGCAGFVVNTKKGLYSVDSGWNLAQRQVARYALQGKITPAQEEQFRQADKKVMALRDTTDLALAEYEKVKGEPGRIKVLFLVADLNKLLAETVKLLKAFGIDIAGMEVKFE